MDDFLRKVYLHEQRTTQRVHKEDNALSELKTIVTSLDPNVQLHVFGSCATGLASRFSDIDVGLASKDGNLAAEKVWNALHAPLSERYTRVKVIPRARVPIIKYNAGGVHMDVSVMLDVNRDIASLLRLYCAPDIPVCENIVRPFLFLLKKWAHARQISDAKTGMLNSLGWCLLGIAYLQHRRILPCFQAAPQAAPHPKSTQDTSRAGGILSMTNATALPHEATRLLRAENTNEKTQTLLTWHEFTEWQQGPCLDVKDTATSVTSSSSPTPFTLNKSLESLLRDFFQFYAESFDATQMAVSVRQGGFVAASTFTRIPDGLFRVRQHARHSPTTTVTAPSATVPAPTTTVPAPTTTVPAPTTTIPAPTTTVPVLTATVPAPTTTVPVPTTTVPVPTVTPTVTITVRTSTVPTPAATDLARKATAAAPSLVCITHPMAPTCGGLAATNVAKREVLPTAVTFVTSMKVENQTIIKLPSATMNTTTNTTVDSSTSYKTAVDFPPTTRVTASSKKQNRHAPKPHKPGRLVLCVEEPFHSTENVARVVNVNQWKVMRSEMSRAYKLLSGDNKQYLFDPLGVRERCDRSKQLRPQSLSTDRDDTRPLHDVTVPRAKMDLLAEKWKQRHTVDGVVPNDDDVRLLRYLATKSRKLAKRFNCATDEKTTSSLCKQDTSATTMLATVASHLTKTNTSSVTMIPMVSDPCLSSVARVRKRKHASLSVSSVSSFKRQRHEERVDSFFKTLPLRQLQTGLRRISVSVGHLSPATVRLVQERLAEQDYETSINPGTGHHSASCPAAARASSSVTNTTITAVVGGSSATSKSGSSVTSDWGTSESPCCADCIYGITLIITDE